MDAQKKNIKKWVIPAFILLCLAQLVLPIKMVADREAVVLKGKAFRFKVAPLDPNDPFRGKYITLRYEADSVKVKNVNEWVRNSKIYALLDTDLQGYAFVRGISASRPDDQLDYVEAFVTVMNLEDKNTLHITYPFNRFYMEETKAMKAEKMFLESLRSPRSNVFAEIYVRDGKAVINDVVINGQSVRDISINLK
ncbi:putative membrane-anchored protein [Arcticibacter pallidicorallinus]|uniref:Putative membrane-anchored protein n=1 Tax=Arcticibacter pallidicorallinus TaxID=1259464 RepID=A0A2T0U9K5_9SPHI|nr:GDYXXLXY domain-containing protein [Arcticibacter pallidicorallinus]PRY54517.1 putative membrane-anchored protein [Arcticibacter pallidicorallinus]